MSMTSILRRFDLALAGGLCLALMTAPMAVAAEGDFATATVTEARAFGYALGDVVSRSMVIEVPSRLTLDEGTLPQVGRRGRALELHAVNISRHRHAGGGERLELRLDYQIFSSPREVRVYDMPSFTLHFKGTPRDEDVRIDAWPVTVSPLSPVEPSPRTGLGDLRPDWPAPLIDTAGPRLRLMIYAGLGLLLLSYLGIVYLGLPWWSTRHRPFTTAWRDLRALPASAGSGVWRAGLQRLHEALNLTAGQVLFEDGVDAFVAARPRYAPLRADLQEFFRRSREAFFGGDGGGAHDGPWLASLSRRLRDAERGAA